MSSHPFASASPLVTFGVLTDVQYADCENRPASYDPTKTRFYRDSLQQITKAFQFWKEHTIPVTFVLQLGDVIDGLNHSLGISHTALQRTLSQFESHSSIPTFHTVGNHELYNFDRKEVADLFFKYMSHTDIPPSVFSRSDLVYKSNKSTSPTLYYKFCPNPHVKCISLDCFDVSVLGYDETHPRYREAADVLQHHHGHEDFNLWDSDGPLKGLDQRFQQMNGALDKDQIRWLEEELTESDRLNQKVIVFGHVSLNPESTEWNCLVWNYAEVVSTFHRHNCVVAYLSGHSHASGYALDSHGIHYIVFAGIVETHPDDMAFATVSVFPDRIEVSGHGREESYVLPLRSVQVNDSIPQSEESEPILSPSIPVTVEV